MLRLYHAGFQVIPSPDVRYGRKNADFGQGFYLTADKAFAQKWAREQKGRRTYINCYELDPDGLSVLRLARGAEWFDYLSRNCAGKPDSLKDYDVITGPVAPDILYDTQGILTSGLLCREHALRLLLLGPEYDQTVLKTEKAAAHLRFLGADELSAAELSAFREAVAREERAYQEVFAGTLSKLLEED